MAPQPTRRALFRRSLLKSAAAAGAVGLAAPFVLVARGEAAAAPMLYRTLGKTGLKVSAAGLGGGGFSRLGLSKGKTEAQVVSLIRLALDLGVNLIDTAAAYGTEAVIGQAIQGVPRERLVITTKASPAHYASWELFPPAAVVASIENSLRQLKTDYLDVLELHAVAPQIYASVRETIYPALLREKEKGKLRFIGITEAAPYDLEHKMLAAALADDERWDCVMVAFNMMHQNARASVFPMTRAKRVGTLIMFAVRGIFAQPERLKAEVRALAAEGKLPKWMGEAPDPLGFLVHEGGASSIIDAAYRFVRDEPGVDVVLFGTSEPEHLREDIASLTKPPLPAADRAKIVELFGRLVGVGIEAPSHRQGAPQDEAPLGGGGGCGGVSAVT